VYLFTTNTKRAMLANRPKSRLIEEYARRVDEGALRV
jgi:hypothetical protein